MAYRILHIPKTGGTALKRSLINNYTKQELNNRYMRTKLNQVYFCSHYVHLDSMSYLYDNIFFVRDPIERFVSHFIFYMKGGMGYYDTDQFMTRRRVKTPHKEVADLKNINEMAMRLKSNPRLKLKKLAWNINYILGGLDNLKENYKYIFYVGRMENLEDDFLAMQNKIGIKKIIPLATDLTNKRPPTLDREVSLTDESREILRKLCDKDYQIIDFLKDKNLLPGDYLT